MSLFPLPAAAAVVQESRLKPNQVDVTFTSADDLLTETTLRISKKADYVTTKILKHSSKDDWGDGSSWPAEDKTRRKALATEVTQEYSVASLLGSAGQLHPAYWERATAKKQEAKELLEALLDDLDEARAAEDAEDETTGGGTSSRRSASVAMQTYF